MLSDTKIWKTIIIRWHTIIGLIERDYTLRSKRVKWHILGFFGLSLYWHPQKDDAKEPSGSVVYIKEPFLMQKNPTPSKEPPVLQKNPKGSLSAAKEPSFLIV